MHIVGFKNQQSGILCVFCGSKLAYRYNMSDYAIWQCQNCGTGRVWPMPNQYVTNKFYVGFCYQADMANKDIIALAADKLYKDLNLPNHGLLTMLDVGDGEGFFAKAFEDYGYGKSIYVDLDEQACAFAKDKVGLKGVFNCDAG